MKSGSRVEWRKIRRKKKKKEEVREVGKIRWIEKNANEEENQLRE